MNWRTLAYRTPTKLFTLTPIFCFIQLLNFQSYPYHSLLYLKELSIICLQKLSHNSKFTLLHLLDSQAYTDIYPNHALVHLRAPQYLPLKSLKILPIYLQTLHLTITRFSCTRKHLILCLH